jgi:hypothetical protein
LLLSALLLLSACGHELLGTWKSVSSEQRTSLTFKSSGAVILEQSDFALEGTYTVKENEVTMLFTEPNGDISRVVANYSISGKKLFLELSSNASRPVEVFTK